MTKRCKDRTRRLHLGRDLVLRTNGGDEAFPNVGQVLFSADTGQTTVFRSDSDLDTAFCAHALALGDISPEILADVIAFYLNLDLPNRRFAGRFPARLHRAHARSRIRVHGEKMIAQRSLFS